MPKTSAPAPEHDDKECENCHYCKHCGKDNTYVKTYPTYYHPYPYYNPNYTIAWTNNTKASGYYLNGQWVQNSIYDIT